ncbi:MAG: biotin--[acetyl-CoA-carboxylase] ligase [Deltaproteobacteria bacterium]|nr:biotin--[acetyl-CoA-carboxylase] ligase [Deltaproteobacteria bacterium]
MPFPDDALLPDTLRSRLAPSPFGKNIIFRDTLHSTNTLAKELAREGAVHGTLVLAEEQTAGRGRMGRPWFSPKYKNILVSLLLRPPTPAEEAFIFTMVLALAAIDGMEKVGGLKASIKWPNDLYAGRKKLGGILTEFSALGKGVAYLVLGLGLNVNWNPGDEEEMLYPATSVSSETGNRISRTDLLVEILKRFEAYYGDVLGGRRDHLYERWNERSLILGKPVKIDTTKGRILGRALRIDQNGALILVDAHGVEQKVFCGDVSLREMQD